MSDFFITVVKTAVDHNDYCKVTFVLQNKEYDILIDNKDMPKYQVRSRHRLTIEPA